MEMVIYRLRHFYLLRYVYSFMIYNKKYFNISIAARKRAEELFKGKNPIQKMIRNMTGKFEIFFFKFHHTHEHEQSPRHQQGLIGLI